MAVQSVSASSYSKANIPANTLDKNLGTHWSAAGDGQWIRYDLGSSQTITSVDIAWYQGDQHTSLFDLQTSDTGTIWTTVYTGSSSGTSTGMESYNVVDSAGRYVRIVGHGNSLSLRNGVSEIEIHGTLALPPATPPGGTVPPPGGPVPPPSTSVGLPSAVLNLANWKLTLPVNTAHAGSPDEILQPELNGFQDLNYFHVNTARNAVVFSAPCGGATTSGSGYPRSELREMINNGTSNAGWSTTSGTHTMEITQAITHLPDVKPDVVAGQIHNANDDVIVFRLEGSKLFVDQNGVNGPVLTANYRLGDVFTVKFVARNGGVECYYNGQYIYTYMINSSGCYFKAGCYTQSNTSKGDAATAYGEVVISRLTITHQ